MQTRASIVIPTYNNEKLLQQCLSSLLATINHELDEIIVVNNGASIGLVDKLKQITNIRVHEIVNEENAGFCKSTNQGMEVSSGKYIVWLNDDTICGPRWLDNLIQSVEEGNINHPNIGLAGPFSNCASGSQTNETFAALTKDNFAGIIPTLEREYNKRKEGSKLLLENLNPLVGFLSGFCLLMKREVYETIGGIDERFSPGGFCDNDFVLRAFEAGYGSVVSTHSFVFHYGSVTLNKHFPQLHRGVANWPTYLKKYRKIADKKLLQITRVKIDDKDQWDLFKACLKKNRAVMDGFLILDDRSEYPEFNSNTIMNETNGKLVGFMQNKQGDSNVDEMSNLKRLIEEAQKLDFDWVVLLDHDEAFDASATPEKMQKLMNPLNPCVRGYKFLFNNFWRSDDLVRVDNLWANTCFNRMWENGKHAVTLRPKLSKDDVGFHCGNVPRSIPSDMFFMSNIGVNHYGYMDINRARNKKDFYEKVDTLKGFERNLLVGPKGYDHLTNESGLALTPVEPFSVGINLMVKNELVNVGHQLLTWSAFCDEILIVDTGSTDGTKEALEQVGIPFYKRELKDDFSSVRNFLIHKTRSKYCFHIDADELAEPVFSEELCKVLRKDVEYCLVDLNSVQKSGDPVITTQPRVFKSSGRLKYAGRVHETLAESVAPGEFTYEKLPCMLVNQGFLRSDESMDKKLELYRRILEKEIQDNPKNLKANFELGLHYKNYNKLNEAIGYFKKALQPNPNAPFIDDSLMADAARELATCYMTKAKLVLESLEGKKVANNGVLKVLKSMHSDLDKWTFLSPKVGTQENATSEN